MKKTKLQWFFLIIGCLIGTSVIAFVAIYLGISWMLFRGSGEYENLDPANKPAMIETTIEWGRLAPFPNDIEDFTIKAGGSIFTRSYRGSFKARNPKIIDDWMKDSPGIMGAKKETIPSGGVKYTISPGGGAQGAEVIVNDNETSVDFYVFWS